VAPGIWMGMGSGIGGFLALLMPRTSMSLCGHRCVADLRDAAGTNAAGRDQNRHDAVTSTRGYCYAVTVIGIEAGCRVVVLALWMRRTFGKAVMLAWLGGGTNQGRPGGDDWTVLHRRARGVPCAG